MSDSLTHNETAETVFSLIERFYEPDSGRDPGLAATQFLASGA